MTKQELVNIIAEHLPISTNDAEDFVDATNNGYLLNKFDNGMAIALRERVIKRLMVENAKLRSELDKR